MSIPEPSTAFNNFTREELIARLLHQEEEIRMGRAFSHISEDAGNDATLQWQGRNRFLSEKIIPVQLERSEADSLNPEKGDHRIINGDNLSVMTSLLAEFRGGRNKGIDVIYLDPPYNTGNDVFSYNDDYRFTPAEVRALKRKVKQTEKAVSLDDPSRHTKWINHIAPRLWAARKLLKSTGVIIVSIDEHELPRLWMLMEEMFGEKNRIATFVWERSRKNDAKYVSEGHEYMLVWARNKEELDAKVRSKGKWRELKPGLQILLDEFDRLRETFADNTVELTQGLKSFVKGINKTNPLWTIRQYINVDLKHQELGPYKEEDPSWPGGGGPDYKVPHPISGIPVRTPPKGWIIGTLEDFNKLVEDDLIVWKGHGTPKIKKYLLGGRENDVVTSVIQKDARQSVMLSKSLFGFDDAFKNPKDHQLLKRLLNIVTWHDPNAVILDGYAGSGTTGHAVIEMNMEDGGSRRFVLIESGDPTVRSKISRERYTTNITAERIRRVITGIWADGKSHAAHDTGFTFYNASKEIDKISIMAATRETLADIILQVVEDDSNRIDCRMDGYRYLIGRTKIGYGIALVWEGKSPNSMQPLTTAIMDTILDEAHAAGVTKPVFIYATGNVAPHAPELYRFQHIPDSILARLNLLPGEGDEPE